MSAPTPPSAPRTIRLQAAYKQEDAIRPVYRNAGGVAERDWDGATPPSHCTGKFLFDRDRTGDRRLIECSVGGGWDWKPVGTALPHRQGRGLMLAVPRKALGLLPARRPLTFDFKRADNLPEPPDIMDFYGKGDVAPNARFDYRTAEPARQGVRRVH